jgi:hypothetical protein
MVKSKSIPIARSSDEWRERQVEEQEAMVADYQDYVFYNRVVDGIRKNQQTTQDVQLRYQNQALIDHITLVRNSQRLISSAQTTASKVLSLRLPPSTFRKHHFYTGGNTDTNEILRAVKDTLALVDSRDMVANEDGLIFEMDI